MSDTPDDQVLAVTFVAEAGRQMLMSSTSVSEVEERLRAFLPTVSLDGCSLDATLSSVIVSYTPPEGGAPVTSMRDVDVKATPRLEVLSGTSELLDRVERGEVGLGDAMVELGALTSRPARGHWVTNLALLLAVAGWVVFFDGTTLLTLLVAVLTTALTLPMAGLVRALGLPGSAATFVVAVLVAAVPNLLAAAGVGVLVGPAIVGSLFIYLPGRAFVSSVIDGLANMPVSSLARGVEAIVTAAFLAFGMLLGSRIGTGFGLDYDPDVTATPLVYSIVGAAVGIFGMALAWSMPAAMLAPAVAIGSAGWLIVALATRYDVSAGWPLYLVGAAVVGTLGLAVAELQHTSRSVYVGVAILPLVPGFALYTGMLAIAEGDSDAARTALGEAGSTSLAIAAGLVIGLGVARNATAVARTIGWPRRRSIAPGPGPRG